MAAPTFIPPALAPRPARGSRQRERARGSAQRARPRRVATMGALRAPPSTGAPPPSRGYERASVPSAEVPGAPGWRFAGPPLESGVLPAVVYFALTAQQSLELDPFNHVVECLMTPGYAAGAREIDASQAPLRVFSVTLPYHTENMADNEAAFGKWAQVYSEGGDVVGGFVRRASDALDALVEQGVIDENSVFTAGLSRGGLMAGHLAARNRRVKGLLGFAPVTVLSDLPEFSDNVVQDAGARVKIARASLLSDEVIERLVFLPVRFYMGNVDRRVGTRNAFELTHLLAEHGVLKEGMRSPPHEFIMYCSVGKHGHGTPSDVFSDGARWILDRL